MKKTTELLKKFKSGELSLEEMEKHLEHPGHSVPDYDREKRTGFPEVIFCERKTPEQVRDIMAALNEKKQNILATRVFPEQWELIKESFPNAEYRKDARIITLMNHPPASLNGKMAIVSAGTSDLPVAEEAALTAEFYGCTVERFYDVGVAGIHRLFSRIETIKSCSVIIVVAGMEGALPSVVGGMVDKPVIAVPTSVGYGASFGGLAALLGMLNSCASGVSVVNIDNGFGAAYTASLIIRGYHHNQSD